MWEAEITEHEVTILSDMDVGRGNVAVENVVVATVMEAAADVVRYFFDIDFVED